MNRDVNVVVYVVAGSDGKPVFCEEGDSFVEEIVIEFGSVCRLVVSLETEEQILGEVVCNCELVYSEGEEGFENFVYFEEFEVKHGYCH